MTTEVPYPNGLRDRVRTLEERQRTTESTMTSVVTAQAVQNEQYAGVKEDVAELKHKLNRILVGVWALFLVSVPIAVSLIIEVSRNS